MNMVYIVPDKRKKVGNLDVPDWCKLLLSVREVFHFQQTFYIEIITSVTTMWSTLSGSRVPVLNIVEIYSNHQQLKVYWEYTSKYMKNERKMLKKPENQLVY